MIKRKMKTTRGMEDGEDQEEAPSPTADVHDVLYDVHDHRSHSADCMKEDIPN